MWGFLKYQRHSLMMIPEVSFLKVRVVLFSLAKMRKKKSLKLMKMTTIYIRDWVHLRNKRTKSRRSPTGIIIKTSSMFVWCVITTIKKNLFKMRPQSIFRFLKSPILDQETSISNDFWRKNKKRSYRKPSSKLIKTSSTSPTAIGKSMKRPLVKRSSILKMNT